MTVEINQELGRVFDDSQFLETRDVGRVLYLRPSQLPFCPLQFWLSVSTEGLTRRSNFYSQFYTSVGTTVHTVVQSHLHRSKRFIANWYCPVCKKTRYFKPVAKCCGLYPQYQEVSINTKGMKGHIDAVFLDRKGRYWIVDFKTSSTSTLSAKKKDPSAAYKEQLKSYAHALSRQLNIKIHGICLVFISRDNPRRRSTWFLELTDNERKQSKLGVARYLRQHRSVLRLTKFSELYELYKNRQCRSLEDMRAFTGECPYVSVCSSHLDQKALLKDIFKAAHYVPISSLRNAHIDNETKDR